MALYLASHVHTCLTGGQLVLLDLRRDEYLGLAGEDAHALAAHVCDWPVVPVSDGSRQRSSEERVRRRLEQLVAKSILTSTPQSKRITPPPVPIVQSALVQERPGIRPHVRARDVVGLVLASMRTRRHLRSGTLESAVEHVRLRKESRAGAYGMKTAEPERDDQVRDAVAAFLYLRPLLFRSKNNCLFDSLALIEYLARRRVFPTWVFGVSVTPFSAHCWVQEETVVFNDSPEHVRRYSPILSV